MIKVTSAMEEDEANFYLDQIEEGVDTDTQEIIPKIDISRGPSNTKLFLKMYEKIDYKQQLLEMIDPDTITGNIIDEYSLNLLLNLILDVYQNNRMDSEYVKRLFTCIILHSDIVEHIVQSPKGLSFISQLSTFFDQLTAQAFVDLLYQIMNKCIAAVNPQEETPVIIQIQIQLFFGVSCSHKLNVCGDIMNQIVQCCSIDITKIIVECYTIVDIEWCIPYLVEKIKNMEYFDLHFYICNTHDKYGSCSLFGFLFKVILEEESIYKIIDLPLLIMTRITDYSNLFDPPLINKFADIMCSEPINPAQFLIFLNELTKYKEDKECIIFESISEDIKERIKSKADSLHSKVIYALLKILLD